MPVLPQVTPVDGSPSAAPPPFHLAVDRTSPVPLYFQVYGAILEGIRRGYFRVNNPLPTESELGDLFGVSRITIRQALAALVQGKQVIRQRPRGALLVRSAPIRQRLTRLSSFFTEDALAQGLEPRFVLLGTSRVKPEQIGQLPQELEGGKLFRIDRKLVDQHSPLALLSSYVPEHRCPGLLEHDLSGSLKTLLETRYGHRYARAEQWLSAHNASDVEANLLELPRRAAVVLIKRMTVTEEGEPIEYLECTLRADRYEFGTRLSTDGSPTL